jgi:hypothetical protein
MPDAIAFSGGPFSDSADKTPRRAVGLPCRGNRAPHLDRPHRARSRRSGGSQTANAMLTGRNPATGEPLGLRAVGGRGAVPGFDLTFSVPKSASLLWALGDAKTSAAVTAATESALGAALVFAAAPPGLEIPKSTSTPWSPTRPRGRTASGPGSTTRRSTTTPRRPAISSRPISDLSCPAAPGSVGKRSIKASPT